MSDDIDYLANYKADQLYTHPGKAGTYATIVGESEHVVGEIDVTSRCKIAVSAFYVNDKADFGTFKLTKLQYHKTHGWRADGHIQINHFQLAQMKEFLSIISNLDLSEAKKTKLSLDNLNVGALGALLSSTKGVELVRELAETPELHQDIYAVAAKRAALTEFEAKLGSDASERKWQDYFEANPWVFGHGLNYVFLDKVGPKLEAVTTGNAFDQSGKRIDALMRTRAEISQYVLVEIKRDATKLLRKDEYRPGCWTASSELSASVTQTQKTVFEFTRNRLHDLLTDEHGNQTGEAAYSVEPRSFVVIGNLAEMRGNNDKIACFELYRRKLVSPEIVTFDELFQRARCIVDNLSSKVELAMEPQPYDPDLDDDVPF